MALSSSSLAIDELPPLVLLVSCRKYLLLKHEQTTEHFPCNNSRFLLKFRFVILSNMNAWTGIFQWTYFVIAANLYKLWDPKPDNCFWISQLSF